MKRINFNWIVLLLTIVAGSYVNNAYSQSWNAQQTEVWKNVETYWDLQTKGDVEGFMTYFSADYMGWDYDSPVPQGKTAVAKYMSNGLKNRKTTFYDITPVAILIHGDVAIVDYYYNLQSENMEGKKNWAHGRWTDILQKQGTKWVLIGDHGGDEKDPK